MKLRKRNEIKSIYFVGQQSEVSPKLDFDENEDKNSTVPVVPGIKHGRNDGRDTEKEKETEEGKGNKSGPKIHGVRVTVDTGDTHKSKGNLKV